MPTVSLFSGLGFGVLQYIDKVVDVPGDAVWLLYGGLWKDFTYFLRVARVVQLESGRYFQSSLLWQPLAPVVATFHGVDSDYFAFHTWRNVELLLRAVSASHRVRQSTLLLEEFHIYFHRVGCPGLPAQFALENVENISARSHMAAGGVFRRLLRIFRAPSCRLELSAIFWSPRW